MSRNNAKVKELSRQAHEIIRGADDENRDLTVDESREVTALLDQIEAHKKATDGANEVQRAFGNAGPVRADGRAVYGNPGAAFTASSGFRQIKDARGQAWTTGPVEVGIQAKGTLLEGTGSPGSGTGGGLVPVPDVTPGVVDKLLTSPLGVAQLFGQRQVSGNTVRYTVEGTANVSSDGSRRGRYQARVNDRAEHGR